MAETLAYYKNGRLVEGSEDTPYPILVWGRTAGGGYVPLLVGADGTLQTAGGGGGGGGDASAANQATQITAEQAILAQLDTKTSALRDAIVKTGATSKTLADLWTLLNGGLPAALDAQNALKIGIASLAGTAPVVRTSGSSFTSDPCLPVNAVDMVWDEGAAIFIRRTGNSLVTDLAAAARTASVNASDHTNYSGKGCHVLVNVTAFTSGGLTPHIQGKDNLGNYYDLLVGTKIVATGVYLFRVHPGIADTAGSSANSALPQKWRVQMVPDDTTSITYSVTSNVLA